MLKMPKSIKSAKNAKNASKKFCSSNMDYLTHLKLRKHPVKHSKKRKCKYIEIRAQMITKLYWYCPYIHSTIVIILQMKKET
jgi:hypothetical protein